MPKNGTLPNWESWEHLPEDIWQALQPHTIQPKHALIFKLISQLINTIYHSDISFERKGVSFIPASALTEAAKGEKQELLADLKNTELLCIDDVGTEPASLKVWGNEVSPLVDLLYHRYDRQLFTIITSNLEGDEDIAKRYGVRVADRFVEMFDLIGFDNSSYRPRLTKLTPR